MNIQKALAKASLASGGKFVVLSSFDSFLSESGRPYLNKTMIQLLSFLTRHHSHFLVSIFRFLSLITTAEPFLKGLISRLQKKTGSDFGVFIFIFIKFSCLNNHKSH